MLCVAVFETGSDLTLPRAFQTKMSNICVIRNIRMQNSKRLEICVTWQSFELGTP